MQSAAVLPTESPVKSLPEILGVPLQRKTFFYPFPFPIRSRWIFFQRAKRSVSRVAGFGVGGGGRLSVQCTSGTNPFSLKLLPEGHAVLFLGCVFKRA